jgi:hypothetical protein
MSTQTTAIRNLLRTHFTGNAPLCVADHERAAVSETIRRRLAGLSYVAHDDKTYWRSAEEKQNFVCSLWINLPKGRVWSDFSVTLKCNQAGQLTLSYARETVLVGSVEEVVAFTRACQAIAEQRHGKTKKQEKVRDLKVQAILAQVKKLAREEQFAFYTRTRALKLELYIKLSDQEHVKLTIPFGKFQEAAPLVREAVLKLRELHQTGIRFRLGQRPPFGWYDRDEWIQPEPLTNE